MSDYRKPEKPVSTPHDFFDELDVRIERGVQREGEKPMYEFLSGRQILETQFPEESYFVAPLIPKDGITCIGGLPGTMKSYFSNYLALSIIRGENALGKYKTDATNILFIDKENKLRRIQDRFLRLGMGQKESENLYYLTSNFILSDTRDLSAVVGFIRDHKIGLTFIDTLVRVHQYEENSASEMNKVFMALKEILMAGSAVCFLHHFNKRGSFGQTIDVRDQLRGSGDILAMVDSYIALTRKENYIEVEQAKSRDEVVIPRFLMEPIFEETETSFQYIKDVEEDGRIDNIVLGDRILSMLSVNSVGRQFLLETLKDGGSSRAAIDRAIRQLKDEGKIITYKNGTGDFMYGINNQIRNND